MNLPTPPPISPIRVATAGEALIDLVDRGDGLLAPIVGGAVLNVARALACQGVGSAYLNPLSSDRFGRRIRAALQADGVQVCETQAVREPTSIAVVSLDETGHPDYSFYRDGVADRATDSNRLSANCARLPALEVVCTGALAFAPVDASIYLPWLRAQKAAGRLVVVDANLRPSAIADMKRYREHVVEALQLADLIKISDEDLAHLDIEGATPVEQATKLLELTTPRALALTMGADGACLITTGALASGSGASRPETILRARDPGPLKIVDTVGAGDCFLAGLLTSLLTSPLESPRGAGAALRQAVASASLCIERQGCQPPSLAEVQARMARIEIR